MARQIVRPQPEKVAAFESQFARFTAARHAIAVSSGRFALDLIIKHLGLEPGTEVIVPAFNYFAVIERFVAAGLIPVFADVRADDLNIDPEDAAGLVTDKSRAILVTHMFGHPCDMSAVGELAKTHDLQVIEDCAHALGSRFKGQHVGTFGSASLFSLSVMKMITGFGGGVLVTNDDRLATCVRDDLGPQLAPAPISERARRFAKGAVLDLGTRRTTFDLAVWPLLRAARILRPDFQQRLMTENPNRTGAARPRHPHLDAFQAHLACNLLDRARPLVEQKRRICRKLQDRLTGIPGVRVLRPTGDAEGSGLYFGILTDAPEALARSRFAAGIDCGSAEYRDCAGLEMYGPYRRRCQVAQDVQRRILRIPSNPDLTENSMNRIATIVRHHVARVSPAGRTAPVPAIS